MRRPFLLGASLGRDSDAYAGEPATRGTSRGAGCYLLRCRAQCLRDGGDSGAAIAARPGIASPALHILTSWYVIGICRLLFVVEFFADKIPAFHLIWDALHTDKSAAGGARPASSHPRHMAERPSSRRCHSFSRTPIQISHSAWVKTPSRFF